MSRSGIRKVSIAFLTQHPELGVIASFSSIALAFALIVPDKFLTTPTLYSMLTLAGELGVASVGVAFLMITGEFNLSVGSVYALVPMGVAIMADSGVDLLLASILMLSVAFLIGVATGYITLRTNVPSFITSLGMMMFLRGILLAVTGGFPVRLTVSHWLTDVLNGPIGTEGLRTSAVWLILLTLFFAVILDFTPYGNWTYAVGASSATARELGVKVFRVKLINFGISSLLAGLAGLMAFSRFRVVDPTLGQGLELDTITSAVLGGCLLTGGYGSIAGTFLGALLVAMTRVGLVLAQAPAYWYSAFIGVILIIAAVINTYIVKKFVTSG
ncbi:MAG: ABC transporter permease [Infirmifilum sp.]